VLINSNDDQGKLGGRTNLNQGTGVRVSVMDLLNKGTGVRVSVIDLLTDVLATDAANVIVRM